MRSHGRFRRAHAVAIARLGRRLAQHSATARAEVDARVDGARRHAEDVSGEESLRRWNESICMGAAERLNDSGEDESRFVHPVDMATAMYKYRRSKGLQETPITAPRIRSVSHWTARIDSASTCGRISINLSEIQLCACNRTIQHVLHPHPFIHVSPFTFHNGGLAENLSHKLFFSLPSG